MNPSKLVMLQQPFFHAPPGTVLGLIQGTYEKNVCDVCGRAVKCDYYMGIEDEHEHMVYMDVCRRCQKIIGFKEADE